MLPNLKLSVNTEVALRLIHPEMLDHKKMEKIFSDNYDRLKKLHTSYWRDNGGINTRSFIPFIYHNVIDSNILGLNKIESLQFEIYLRDLDSPFLVQDNGHREYFGDMLFYLIQQIVDKKIIDIERYEVLSERGKCTQCEESKHRCKCNLEGDDW